MSLTNPSNVGSLEPDISAFLGGGPVSQNEPSSAKKMTRPDLKQYLRTFVNDIFKAACGWNSEECSLSGQNAHKYGGRKQLLKKKNVSTISIFQAIDFVI